MKACLHPNHSKVPCRKPQGHDGPHSWEGEVGPHSWQVPEGGRVIHVPEVQPIPESADDAWRLVKAGEVAPIEGGHGSWVETNHPAVVNCMGSSPACAQNGCQYRQAFLAGVAAGYRRAIVDPKAVPGLDRAIVPCEVAELLLLDFLDGAERDRRARWPKVAPIVQPAPFPSVCTRCGSDVISVVKEAGAQCDRCKLVWSAPGAEFEGLS